MTPSQFQTWFEIEVSQLRSATPVVTWRNGVLYIFTPTNVELEPDRLLTKIIMFIKPKGRKQYICCFLQNQILKAQKRINHEK